MTADLRIALIQSDLKWEQPEANFANLEKKLPEPNSCDLILLPEMFATGFTMHPEKWAIPANGPAVAWMHRIAQNQNCAVGGSLAVVEDGKYFNRFFIVKPNGQQATYDKRHLFGLAGEDQVYSAGQHRVVTDIKGWKVLLQVCYDLRFPVFSRNIDPYDLALYVANWPERRVSAWNTLLPARAIENQCYVAAVNRIGPDGHGINHNGCSAIYSYDGAPLLGPIEKAEGCFIQKISHSDLLAFRKQLPFLKDGDSFQLAP
jgi:omega-amidase